MTSLQTTNTLSSLNIKLAVQSYAKSGKPVFPCASNKAPMIVGGFKSASRDYKTIENWWHKWPKALIGLPTGKVSGLFVIDIDVKSGVNGFDSLAALEEQYEALPATLTVKTPSGGEHRYFIMPETELPLGNTAGKLGAGIDTRGEGGYVIAPPSLNSSGQAYKYVDRSLDPVELPLWVIDLLKKSKTSPTPTVPNPDSSSGGTPYGKAALEGLFAEMASTTEGHRNETLNKLAFRAGQLVAGGEIKKSDSPAIIQAAISAGLSEEETRKTFASGFEAGLESPATASPAKALKNKKARTDDVIIQRASDIPMVPIEWLWAGWLPKGKLTILAGQAGTGKTTIAISIAATVSAGGEFPDGFSSEPGNILIWSAEDAPEDTLIPRLEASGANLDRCYFIQGSIVDGVRQPFDPATDIINLEKKVKQIGEVGLLIIDPVVSAVHGDMNKANDVRRGLQPLVDFGANNNCAVLGITHFKKGSAGSIAQERIIGSQAFGALARMVLIAAQEDGKEKRVVARAKSNIAPDNGGFEYL